jgi:RNA polymerase-associated protein RTF1
VRGSSHVTLAVIKMLEDLGVDIVKPYMIDDKTVNQTFELKHGKSIRLFLMDKVSNSQFLPVGAQFSCLLLVF